MTFLLQQEGDILAATEQLNLIYYMPTSPGLINKKIKVENSFILLLPYLCSLFVIAVTIYMLTESEYLLAFATAPALLYIFVDFLRAAGFVKIFGSFVGAGIIDTPLIIIFHILAGKIGVTNQVRGWLMLLIVVVMCLVSIAFAYPDEGVWDALVRKIFAHIPIINFIF